MLLVGNHSGGNLTPDTTVFTLAFYAYFGVERRLLPARPQPRALDARARRSCASTARSPPRRTTRARRWRRAPRCSSTRAATTRSTGPRGSATRSTSTAARASSAWRSSRTSRSSRSCRSAGRRPRSSSRRGEGLATAARPRPRLPPEGPADLARPPVGAQRRRHARPHPAAGEDHRRGAAADPPARGVRARARPRRGLRPRHARSCRRRSTRSPPSAACRCSDEGRATRIDDRRAARGGVGVRSPTPPATCTSCPGSPAGRSVSDERDRASARATGCSCGSARPRSAA